MKKHPVWRLLPAFLAIVLLCALLIFPASGSSSVYLMSVNDKVKPDLTADNMPRMVNNTLYIPYTMLSSQVTGVDLGVRATYNSSRGTLTVTNDKKIVVFDTRQNTASASDGAVLSARALVRNSMIYIPVDWLCSYFTELEYTLNRTSYGTLIRLTNSAVVLDDIQFIDAAEQLLKENLQNYQNSLSTPTTSPSPTVTVTPSPSPSKTPDPVPEICLALRWEEQASGVAEALENNGQRALFLFSVDELAAKDDLIRRLVGRGHQIGLALTSSDVDACLVQLAEGRRLLTDIARCTIIIISADELDNSGLAVLREAGCAVWSTDMTADGMTKSALVHRLDPYSPNYIELTCDVDGLKLLNDVLKSHISGELQLCQTLAPML